MTPEEEPHLAVGAYVLHALPPGEEAAFENHLAGCATCRRDVAALRETAAALADEESAPVPQDLRARTLDAIGGVRQDRRRTRTSPATGRRALVLALAASLAAAAALGGIAAWQHTKATDARTQATQARTANRELTDVVTAPDATLHVGELSGGGTAAVVVSRAQARAVFTAENLPALSGGKVYELWYASGGGALRPAGLVPGRAGTATRLLDGALAGAVAVGVTVEPSGGSRQPTSEPLGLIPITA